MGGLQRRHGVLKTYFWKGGVEVKAYLFIPIGRRQCSVHIIKEKQKNLFTSVFLLAFCCAASSGVDGNGTSLQWLQINKWTLLLSDFPPETWARDAEEETRRHDGIMKSTYFLLWLTECSQLSHPALSLQGPHGGEPLASSRRAPWQPRSPGSWLCHLLAH